MRRTWDHQPPQRGLRRSPGTAIAGFVLRALLLGLAACPQAGVEAPGNSAFTAKTHTPFPVSSGPHAVSCNTCHGAFDTFKQFDCLGCHAHDRAPTDLVHNPSAVPAYGATGYQSDRCYSCHTTDDGTRKAYSHAGIAGGCAGCHDVGASFAALPKAGFTHTATGGADCAGCHVPTDWKKATGAPDLASDPARDVKIDGRVPTFSQTTVARFTLLSEVLPMPMNHKVTSAAFGGAQAPRDQAFSACLNCHPTAGAGAYFPGVLHASLDVLKVPQPTACLECHATSAPAGFVGPIPAPPLPVRSPPSGEMAHDAVTWTGPLRGATPLVPQECSLCHLTAGWGRDKSGTTKAAQFHASLTGAQPAQCLDCHANARPVALLTSSNAALLPASLTFDHQGPAAVPECAACHVASAPQFTAWSGGRYHLASSKPATCLPCHAGERPASGSATNLQLPFDYGALSNGNTHGTGLDCVTCHAGPGTGVWGATQNWKAGSFDHASAAITRRTCIACHATQRPDLQPDLQPRPDKAAVAGVLGFDHGADGTGDCSGCHQATVKAGQYATYGTPATVQSSGDWKGGQKYPGSTLVSSSQFVAVDEYTLVRAGGLIDHANKVTASLYDAMLHVSTALPAELNAGPSDTPDQAKCWHCHVNTAGTVTSYAGGKYHQSLTAYAPTFGGTPAPFPQPTTLCLDCHTGTTPVGIVEKLPTPPLPPDYLRPMDHAASFTAPATIGGVTAGGVAGLQCAICHQKPGDTWTDGVFHSKIGAAVPADCTACHYQLMADTARSEIPTGNAQAGTQFTMKHKAAQVTFQSCETCHAGALSKATATPVASASWSGAVFHAALPAQPTACTVCHLGPAADQSTQSSVAYNLPLAGRTTTNTKQWMNHGSTDVSGKDCFACHANDAKSSGPSVWSKAASYHAQVPAAAECKSCHGLTNGGGSVPGASNNLPSGATDSTTASAASAAAVPAGTKAQLDHADINVTGVDCNACHTQKGVAASGPAVGAEWAQATFHGLFTPSNPLKLGPATGRCSTCHINERPGSAFTAWDHSGYSKVSGTQDCAGCHTYPGTGSSSAPNWLGAAGVPTFLSVGGFTVLQPPASSAITQAGIANLPHPTVGSTACTACHAASAGGRQATGYDHLSPLGKTNCNACHEAGSDLVGTVWNKATSTAGGAGDTRPFTLTTAVATYKGNTSTFTVPSHFYVTGNAVDCAFCHVVPLGNGNVTSGTAYKAAWVFKHPPENGCTSSCKLCHTAGCP